MSGHNHGISGNSFDEKSSAIDFGADMFNNDSVSHDAVLDDAAYTVNWLVL